MPETSHYLGIDFGAAKIGLAIADEETRLSFAYGILDNDSKLSDKIAEIIKEKNVSRVIIGRPTHKIFANSDSITRFGLEILHRFGVPIEYQEEMFTTKMAAENIRSASGKVTNGRDDAEAARLILQSWLDRA